MSDEQYRIGELAHAAGVTVRALHHYDRLGLLVPSCSARTAHRLYTAADLQRLYRLLALRELGLPLGEIGAVLDADDALSGTVRRHLEPRRAPARAARGASPAAHLAARRARRRRAVDPHRSWRPWKRCRCSRSTTRPSSSPSSSAAAQEFGDDKIKAVEREWAELYASLREHRERGTDPGRPRRAGARPPRRRAGRDVHRRRPRHPRLARSACTSRRAPARVPRHGGPRGPGLSRRDQGCPVVIPSAGQSACSVTASSRIARRHCGGASSHE